MPWDSGFLDVSDFSGDPDTVSISGILKFTLRRIAKPWNGLSSGLLSLGTK